MAPSTRRRIKFSREFRERKEHKQQLVDMPLDVLVEVRVLRELIALNVQYLTTVSLARSSFS